MSRLNERIATTGQGESLLEAQSRILESIARGHPLNDTLRALCLCIEKQSAYATRCAIMILDQDGETLHPAACPSFPEGLVQSLNDFKVGKNAASCGTAVYTGKLVVVRDVFTDSRWRDYHSLADRYKIRACWSSPIFASTGDCLGTFALTHPDQRTPSGYDLTLLETGSHLAAIAMERRKVEDDLRLSQERYRNIFETTAIAILEEDVSELVVALDRLRKRPVTDFARYFKAHPEFVRKARQSITVLDANQAALKLYEAQSKQELTGPLDRLFTPASWAIFEQELLALAQGDSYFEAEMSIRSLRGKQLNVLHSVRMPPASGKDRLLVSTIDITNRKQIENQLRQLSEAVELSPVSVVITDQRGIIQYVNPYFLTSSGYSTDEVMGRTLRVLESGPATQASSYDSIWSGLAAGRAWSGELLNKTKNGDLLWEQCFFSPIKSADDTTTHFLAVKENITQRKVQEERLLRQANYDPLTDLPNRLLAIDRLSQALAVATRYRQRFVALLYVDLDRFKNVNDTLGHESGDRLLVESARRLKACVREEDTVARLGGDEFLVILPDLKRASNAETVAEKIRRCFTRPFRLKNTKMFVSASIGITIFPDDAKDPTVLLRNADAAMYRAKTQGRNAYHYFTPQMNEHAAERMKIEAHLRHALDRGEFFLNYQPLIDARDGTLLGVEALLRWKDGEFGLIDPDRFIPAAEQTGLIITIGEWVLNTACRQIKDWRLEGYSDLRMAVNVSSRQLHTGRFIQTVSEALTRNGLTADALELELTESLLMDDTPDTSALFSQLDAMGVRLTIDDFGTGFSSLNYLRRFSFDTLKIDRSFVSDIGTNADDASLIKAIIAMAQALRLKVIAEGVETEEQINLLRAERCDVFQGFYYGKPCSADAFSDYLAKHRRGLNSL